MIPAHRTLIILASSRPKGDTWRMAYYLQQKGGYDMVDLTTKQIGYFDYEFKNSGDDFLPLMRQIASDYDLLVFATPVYWYNMSAQLKTFFDRFSDLLRYEKPTGRQLRGKAMAVVSCASEDELKEGFEMPFIESANYLGMHYLGIVHGWVDEQKKDIPELVKQRLNDFSKHLSSWQKPK